MSRRGALTGGYYDTRKSRLDCQRSIQEVKSEIETYRTRHGEVREELERILLLLITSKLLITSMGVSVFLQ